MKQCFCTDIVKMKDSEVELYGWVRSRCDHGKLIFLRGKMGILDRDYSKDKLKQIDPQEEKKNNWLIILGIVIGIGAIVYLFLR